MTDRITMMVSALPLTWLAKEFDIPQDIVNFIHNSNPANVQVEGFDNLLDSHLNQLDRPHLLTFIRQRAKIRKDEIEGLVSIDCNSQFLRYVEGKQKVDTAKDNYSRMIEKYERRSDQVRASIKDLTIKAEEEEKKANEAQANYEKHDKIFTEEHKKYKEMLSHKIKAQKEITKELVKEAYIVLEKHNSPPLERMCELYVSIIRGKETSTNQDVEHYLKKYEGLAVAMNKVDAS